MSARRSFGLDPALPTVLVIGGGTGARALNELVWGSVSAFAERANILHVTGAGKG
ncbi:UDP-N-acetylglucosamine--N-acetylmuramyl-(pentapeptide) pyrophosphoryl-undecaprenol N-acetylglucosamine transferase, partial [Candidatus Uhrbacteria bacterium]|nr:UDP-N-acetylglucosamine--N-acetylmuramyl-(pentapeptide) pyrophosphoryl-undecaprenol N-acetylglucosamine transferase [Candidatus Uhrbacteria bacterium]